MTYSVDGIIQATDLNGFVSTNTPNVNNIWSTGSGNSGYGQGDLATVVQGGTITASNWASVVNTITNMAAHQNTSITSITAPGANGQINYLSALSTNLSSVNTSRLNATVQGSTTSTTKTNSSAWSGTGYTHTLVMTSTITFNGGANAARYFFNSGGQIQLNFSHPVGTSSVDAYLSQLCSDAGSMLLSSPSGSATAIIVPPSVYTGFKKVGGAGTTSAYNTQYGFYDLNGSAKTLMIQQDTASSYYSSSTITLSATSTGSTVVFTITFNVMDSGSYYYGGSTPSSGTAIVTTIKPPSTTYLSNTWGTQSVS